MGDGGSWVLEYSDDLHKSMMDLVDGSHRIVVVVRQSQSPIRRGIGGLVTGYWVWYVGLSYKVNLESSITLSKWFSMDLKDLGTKVMNEISF